VKKENGMGIKWVNMENMSLEILRARRRTLKVKGPIP
jgi:hypothetical protein